MITASYSFGLVFIWKSPIASLFAESALNVKLIRMQTFAQEKILLSEFA
jgi:hypothetical protein